jgi:hypothetical protein
MEEGFIYDAFGSPGGKPSEWVEGAAENSFWFGVKAIGKAHREVRTYRCTGCSYLKSYAD